VSAFDKDSAIHAIMTALQLKDESELIDLAKRYGIDLDDESHLETLRKVAFANMPHEGEDPLKRVPADQWSALAKSFGIDGDANTRSGMTAETMADLRKAAAARPYAIERFLAEPRPPKTLGAGSQHTMSREQLAKGSHIPGQQFEDDIAKVDVMRDVHPGALLNAEWRR
jgi:hypothetical protein